MNNLRFLFYYQNKWNWESGSPNLGQFQFWLLHHITGTGNQVLPRTKRRFQFWFQFWKTRVDSDPVLLNPRLKSVIHYQLTSVQPTVLVFFFQFLFFFQNLSSCSPFSSTLQNGSENLILGLFLQKYKFQFLFSNQFHKSDALPIRIILIRTKISSSN